MPNIILWYVFYIPTILIRSFVMSLFQKETKDKRDPMSVLEIDNAISNIRPHYLNNMKFFLNIEDQCLYNYFTNIMNIKDHELTNGTTSLVQGNGKGKYILVKGYKCIKGQYSFDASDINLDDLISFILFNSKSTKGEDDSFSANYNIDTVDKYTALLYSIIDNKRKLYSAEDRVLFDFHPSLKISPTNAAVYLAMCKVGASMGLDGLRKEYDLVKKYYTFLSKFSKNNIVRSLLGLTFVPRNNLEKHLAKQFDNPFQVKGTTNKELIGWHLVRKKI